MQRIYIVKAVLEFLKGGHKGRSLPRVLERAGTWNKALMIRFKALVLLTLLMGLLGCEGLPQEKPLDQGKVDRAMDQIEKGQE